MRVETSAKVELSVTIDGKQVFGLFGEDMALACGDADRDLVLSALSEALVVLCGTRPRPDPDIQISVRPAGPAPVLKLVPSK